MQPICSGVYFIFSFISFNLLLISFLDVEGLCEQKTKRKVQIELKKTHFLFVVVVVVIC
jgi:hypothetical protein